MNLIRFTMGSREPQISTVPLADLWEEAESLGAICVRQDGFSGDYEVSISFETDPGSEIEAKSRPKHPNILIALSTAIDEARRLKNA